MYKTSTYGHEQGLGCCVRHPARARHPCRRRQLRLCHHQASGRVVRRAPAVDRRHALSRAAPARASGSCRGEVVLVRKRPPAQVLPDHSRRPGAAGRPAAAVAGRGQYPSGYLDAGVHGMTTFADQALEEQIAQWREYLRRRQVFHGSDVEELEGHLRDQLAALTKAGLAGEEAFLVAVKRMGNLDALSREFAREHSDRLWKQLVIGPGAADESAHTGHTEMLVVLGLAVAAALAVKVPALFGLRPDGGAEMFYFRNASLFVLPLLTVYFIWKRRSGVKSALWLALPFAAAAVCANIFPFGTASDTERLTALHLPIALWLVVWLVLYAASARDPQAPPDFFDGLQLLLVVSALVVDGVALGAIAARISEFGFTPNRVAALGENLILLVNLAWTAWLYARFLRHRGSFATLERWQIAYLPVYAVWAALVVVMFPPLFGYR